MLPVQPEAVVCGCPCVVVAEDVRHAHAAAVDRLVVRHVDLRRLTVSPNANGWPSVGVTKRTTGRLPTVTST